MPLASKLAFQFERPLQFKGLNLFHARAVRISEANQAHLFGEVQGGNRYPIRMTHDALPISVYCACPYFADFGRCKHLWAAVLEADRRGVLGEASKGGALRLCRDQIGRAQRLNSSHLGISYAVFCLNTATTEIYPLSLHDALPISLGGRPGSRPARRAGGSQQGRRPAPVPRPRTRRRSATGPMGTSHPSAPSPADAT